MNPSGTTLTIGLVRPSDAGTYQCVAESAGGRRAATAQLSVITQGTRACSVLPTHTRLVALFRHYSGEQVPEW